MTDSMAGTSTGIPVEELCFRDVAKFVAIMKQVRFDLQNRSEKSKKRFSEADAKVQVTQKFLLNLKRPADLYPLCRLLFPQARPPSQPPGLNGVLHLRGNCARCQPKCRIAPARPPDFTLQMLFPGAPTPRQHRLHHAVRLQKVWSESCRARQEARGCFPIGCKGHTSSHRCQDRHPCRGFRPCRGPPHLTP